MTRDYAVIVPTCNRYTDCVRAVRSALSQSVPPVEVVVVDDASTDKRYEWLEEIVDDCRLTYLRMPQNSREMMGVGYAIGTVRNRGLAYLDGLRFDGWIAFLDDDDEWVPDKAEKQFLAVERYGNCRVVCSNANNRTPTGEIVGRHHPEHGTHIGGGVFDVTAELQRQNTVVNSSAMITSPLRRRIGAQQATGYGEDYAFWRRAARHTRVLRVDEPLVHYTVGNPKAYT